MNQTPVQRRLRCGRCAGTGGLRSGEECDNCEGRGFHHVEPDRTEIGKRESGDYRMRITRDGDEMATTDVKVIVFEVVR